MGHLEKRYPIAIPLNATIALGNTLIWDFEYQAYVLSYRRCLDYLTRGIAAFFKHEFHSFRKLNRSLQGLQPASVSNALSEVYSRHAERLSFALSDGDRKSVRDTITHYDCGKCGGYKSSS